MEVAILNNMIDDRDRRIATIKRKMEDSYHKYVQLETELEAMKQSRTKSSMKNQTEFEALSIKRHDALRKLNRMLDDLKKQQGAFTYYSNVISGDNNNNSNGDYNNNNHNNADIGNNHNNTNSSALSDLSERTMALSRKTLGFVGFGGGSNNTPGGNYQNGYNSRKNSDGSMVMRMQAQLCKVMHSMGIVDHQLEMLRDTCDDLISEMKVMLQENTDARSQLELKLMNELMMADSEVRDQKDEFKKKQDEMREQIMQYEKKYGKDDSIQGYTDHDRSMDDYEDSDSDSESDYDSDGYDSETNRGGDDHDEHDSEEKHFLRKSLKLRRSEISDLEKEIEEQKDMIRAVKVRLSLREMTNTGDDDDDGGGGEENSSDSDETDPESGSEYGTDTEEPTESEDSNPAKEKSKKSNTTKTKTVEGQETLEQQPEQEDVEQQSQPTRKSPRNAFALEVVKETECEDGE